MSWSPSWKFYLFFSYFLFHWSLLVILNKTDASYFLNHLQGPTEFTETLNRVAVITLAILIKTRGIADADHLLYLPNMLEQALAASQHTWSEKTLRYFPPILREALSGRMDKRSLAIQAWQQVCITSCITISTVINH